MVGLTNHTTIYIPVGPIDVPLVGTLDPQAKGTSTLSANSAKTANLSGNVP